MNNERLYWVLAIIIVGFLCLLIGANITKNKYEKQNYLDSVLRANQIIEYVIKDSLREIELNDLEILNNQKDKSIAKLEAECKLTLAWIMGNSANANYKAIEEKILPTIAEKRYCFDSIQIQDINYKLTDYGFVVSICDQLKMRDSISKDMLSIYKQRLNDCKGLLSGLQTVKPEVKNFEVLPFNIYLAYNIKSEYAQLERWNKGNMSMGFQTGLRYKRVNVMIDLNTWYSNLKAGVIF